MNQSNWQTNTEFRELYELVRPEASTRKLRLLMVGCCRLESANFFDPAIVDAVSTAEKCADDPKIEETVCQLWNELVISQRPRLEGAIGEVIRRIWNLTLARERPLNDDVPYASAHAAVTHAAMFCLREEPEAVFTGGDGDAVEYCSFAIAWAQKSKLSESEKAATVVCILRDIFANPFRPIEFDPRWRTDDVVGLARGIYEARAFERMPILADALMDAGCENEEIISHCRGNGPHVRGCWVVDCVLGKE